MGDEASPPVAALASSTAAPPSFPRKFYRRQLPPTCVPFSSTEGREIFASAMAGGGTRSFFSLIEQLQTQPEPAYCGLTTLVIVLNALAVDPRRSWKGPWRWYEESMLNSCVDLESVKKTGITFAACACLAKSQGLNVTAVYGSKSSVDEFRDTVKRVCTAPSAIQTQPTSFLIVSYTRKVISQTGTGHISPIGAYDAASDRVLVLDTARFKYGPHWVPLQLMFEALLPLDPGSGKSRGYMVLGYGGAGTGNEMVPSRLPLSVLFGSKKSKDFLRKEYKRYLHILEEEGAGGGVSLASVVSFWTKNETDGNDVWELVEPQLKPVDSAEVQMVESVRQLVRSLIKANGHTSVFSPDSFLPGGACYCSCSCCPINRCFCGSTGYGRVIEISPAEVLYIIYLASLPAAARRDAVHATGLDGAASDADDAAMEQLLAEADLISFAIETCDVDGV